MPQKLPVQRSVSDFFAPYFWNPMRLASLWWDEDAALPVQRGMNRMFRDIMEGWPETGAEAFTEDVREDAKSFCLCLNVPGLEAGDIAISAEDGVLTVEAERQEKKNGAETRYSYSRSMSLPDNAEAGKAEASLSDGVLTIEIPKTNGNGDRRKIAVCSRDSRTEDNRRNRKQRGKSGARTESRADQGHN